MEVTIYGDSASVQAVTRVNAEQASKRTMRRPTLRGADKEREAVPITRDAERPLPHARRPVTRRSKG
jgi:hypothetical protein